VDDLAAIVEPAGDVQRLGQVTAGGIHVV